MFRNTYLKLGIKFYMLHMGLTWKCNDIVVELPGQYHITHRFVTLHFQHFD